LNQTNQKSTEKAGEIEVKPEDRLKPNFGLSGKLAEDTNTFNGVVVKYNEPPEAKIPTKKWRLYPFKGEQTLEFIPVFKQSAFLLGRDRKVADIAIDHPSCSSQHAVLQFRMIEFEREDGTTGKRVKPYIIDLESSNGTFVNNKKIEPKRYYELFEKDMVKFAFSSREYVLMSENYVDSEDDLSPAAPTEDKP
jgi:smad nuclear-interacting protein 1